MSFLDPKEVLKSVKPKKNWIAADFGCGSGGWAIPLAQILKDGKVYAIDILEEPLSSLRAKIKLFKISNIETVKADVEKNSKVRSDSCDLVLMSNLLFQSDAIKEMLEEARRILKNKGNLLIVDWEKDVAFGPENKVARDDAQEIAENSGFKLDKEFKAGIYHWALVFEKNETC